MFTGNLIAAVDRFGDRSPGQIVLYTKDDGTIATGMLIPRNFDLAQTMADEAVIFPTADVAAAFIKGHNGILADKDGLVKIVQSGGLFKVEIQKAGGRGKPLFLLKAAEPHYQLLREQGKLYVGHVEPSKLGPLLAAYSDNLGIQWQTQTFKDEAKAMLPQPDVKLRALSAGARTPRAAAQSVASQVSEAMRRYRLAGKVSDARTCRTCRSPTVSDIRRSGCSGPPS